MRRGKNLVVVVMVVVLVVVGEVVLTGWIDIDEM